MPMMSEYGRGEGEMDLVASHQRILVGAVLRTPGDILELGVGWYSTPILHELATILDRDLFTADNNPHWLAQFKCLECSRHKLVDVGWWGDLYAWARCISWGVVFVDHAQPIEREYAIRALKGNAAVFVLHDTEEGFAYGYSRTIPSFKYQYTDKCQKAWTTIVSDTVDVSEWFKDLPPVEPTSEIT